MKVRSTRSEGTLDFLAAVERGLAPDGGLYMPTVWGALPEPPRDLGPDFADTAAWAAGRLLDGVLPPDELEARTRDALDFEVPVVPLGDDLDLLELFHGPTLAFKDVGARYLARLWSASGHERRTVLVATSGDTGGAVAQACFGVPGVRVMVLFPSGRVSEVQRHQFTTLGGNVRAVAVDGPFDRCQGLAKELLASPEMVERFGLTSANSINIGRLVPQVFYYLHLARARGWGRGPVDPRPVVVPSGNLGNITAGILARRAGAPLGEMIAACNRNDAVVRYLADGSTTRVQVTETTSTAMDVGAPSNLERLLDILGSDPADLGRGISAVTVSEEEAASAMRWAREAHEMVVDPHTAVGIAAARMDRWREARPTVLATAHPAKFPDVVDGILGEPPPTVGRLSAALARPEQVRVLDGDALALADLIDEAFAAPE